MELIRATKSVCKKCKYRASFGATAGKTQTNNNICCNYLICTKHSRIFKDGEMQYDPKYCDKFERGKKVEAGAWEANDLSICFLRIGGKRNEEIFDNSSGGYPDSEAGNSPI